MLHAKDTNHSDHAGTLHNSQPIWSILNHIVVAGVAALETVSRLQQEKETPQAYLHKALKLLPAAPQRSTNPVTPSIPRAPPKEIPKQALSVDCFSPSR